MGVSLLCDWGVLTHNCGRAKGVNTQHAIVSIQKFVPDVFITGLMTLFF